MIRFYFAAILSGILSSIQQILLKKSSMSEHKDLVTEYINFRVVLGYMINVICVLLMVYAYKGIPFRYGPIFEAFAYIYVMILSRLILGEPFTKKRFLGNLLILIGAFVFSL